MLTTRTQNKYSLSDITLPAYAGCFTTMPTTIIKIIQIHNKIPSYISQGKTNPLRSLAAP